jgi:uncharacterized membrane protein
VRKQTKFIVERVYAIILTIGGALGLVAMTWQAAERIQMLKTPGLSLSCNLSPIVDCSGVLDNHLAAVLGFPNAFLGMIFFAILTTSGLVLLSGGKFVGWYRHFVMGVSTILILFSAWFFGVSLYIIGKICIFCVVGWIVSVPMFWYGLLHYLQTANGKVKTKTLAFTKFGLKHHIDVVIYAYVVMILLFLFRFRDYYFN